MSTTDTPQAPRRESHPPAARGIVMGHANDARMTWLRIMKEYFDNSLDADAHAIEFIKDGPELVIRDDGRGCPDPIVMVSLGHTKPHSADSPRSGFYGMGGKVAGIRASQGTSVEVESVVGGRTHRVIANWRRMIEEDRFLYDRYDPMPALRTSRPGTTIKIYNCRPLANLDKIVRDLEWSYADPLASGVSIRIAIEGHARQLRPYEPPPFADSMDCTIDHRGRPVRILCGLVADGHPNPYPGFTFHWGPHRVLKLSTDPAGSKSVSRLQGHVYLPPGWDNHNLTKDDFAEEPEDLYAAIGAACRRIIDAADQAGTTLELQGFSAQIEERINRTLESIRVGIKGRREKPENPKRGAVIPTGTGSPHRHFTKSQPGDKATAEELADQELARRIPTRVQVRWDETLETPWWVDIRGKRNVVGEVILNPSNRLIGAMRNGGDIAGLELAVTFIVCSHFDINKGDQKMFGIFQEMNMMDLFALMSSRPTPPAVATIPAA